MAEAGPLLDPDLEDFFPLLLETPEGGIIARLMLFSGAAGAASSSEDFPTETLSFFRASILLRPMTGLGFGDSSCFLAAEELLTFENDIPELFNFFNESVSTELDFWGSTCSFDLVMEIPELFIAAGGFEAGAGEEIERVEFFNLFSLDSAVEETAEGGGMTSGLTSVDFEAGVVCLPIVMLELASNLEGSSDGLADIAFGVDDGEGAGAVLRPRLDLGLVSSALGVLGVLGAGWVSVLLTSVCCSELSFVRFTRATLLLVLTAGETLAGVTGELSQTLSL